MANPASKNLYFIALIPDQEIREDVKILKLEMRNNYGAKHALKSPAHITLIPPFRRNQQHESFIIDSLFRFVSKQNSFSVELDGFGNFEPRVIYIDVKQAPQIRNLNEELCSTFLNEMLFHPDELKSKIHPHMTLATRDLTQEAYKQAWPNFKSRKYSAKFDVDSIFLLKHNGKFWDIYREFEFPGISS